MTNRPPDLRIALPALALHLALTAVVWRDISRRRPSELRGGRTLWRVLTALNTGNHLVYLLVGRRRRG
jgi:hypothetical protein